MLSTLVLCEAEGPGTLPVSNGYAVFAAVSKLLRSRDIGDTIHGEGERKPFTFSRLLPLDAWEHPALRPPPAAETAARGGEAFAFRATFLRDEDGKAFAEGCEGAHFSVERKAAFAVRRCLSPGTHAFAKRATPGQLCSANVRRLVFRFLSPTGFRSMGVQMPFPLPALVFRSLLAHWRAYVEPEAWPKLDERLGEILVESFSVRSEAVRLKGGNLLRGCVGNAVYDTSQLEEPLARAAAALAGFAFFAGVGYKTSQGLGQVIAVGA